MTPKAPSDFADERLPWWRLLPIASIYLAILGALAAAHLWWGFWVAVVLTVAGWTTGGVFVYRRLKALRARGGAGAAPSPDPAQSAEPPAVASARWIQRHSWGLAAGCTLVGLAMIAPLLRHSAWGTVVAVATFEFLLMGVIFRVMGRWHVKYEVEFDRWTKHRSAPRPPQP